MQEHLSRALTFLRGGVVFIFKALREVWAWARTNKKISIPAAVVIVAALIAAGYFLGQSVVPPDADQRRAVEMVAVADISSGEPITVIGEIKSVSEASVAPDSSGRVTRVYRAIGDYVSAGAVIAEIENASQRAAVAQAEASLNRAKSGSAISGISVESALASGETVRQSAYAAINSAVTIKADASFSNPNSSQPYFYIATPNSQLKNTVETGRLLAGGILKRHTSVRSETMTQTALIAELQTLQSEVAEVREFLANLVSILSTAIATGSVSESQIAANEAEANAALASVTSLEGSIAGAIAGIKSASENLTQGGSGVSADVALATAALDAAKAVLEKTIVRAPISGTINSISLEAGNFAAAGVPSVRIVNVSGLEAVAYLSERDLPRVRVGSTARISGLADGRVSRVAPALDSGTRKAEVRIAIQDVSRFVAGQSATIEISPLRSTSDIAIYIPIASVKITPDGAIVFVLERAEGAESGILVPLPVTLGSLSGGKVEITSGLSLSNSIVADARGLKEGQEVLVQTR